jgi:hypothetical protein
MNTESHSPAVDRYPDPFIISFVLCQAAGSVDRLACPRTAAPRPFAIINPPIDQSRSIHRKPPQPTPTPRPPVVGWCGFLTDRSSYRYDHRDPQSSRRSLSRSALSFGCLCRAVGCYLDPLSAVRNSMQPPTPPHAIHEKFDAPPTPPLSTIVPAHPHTRPGPGGAGF